MNHNVLWIEWKQKREENESFPFLAALNWVWEFDEVRSRILWKYPLPSLCETFSAIRREETRKKVKTRLDLDVELKPTIDFLALVIVKNKDDKIKRSWWDHCKKHWHARETCWKIYGKPLNWKKRVDNRGFQYQSEQAIQKTYFDQGQQPSPETSPFTRTREQLEILHKLLHSPQFRPNAPNSYNPSYFFAETDIVSSAFFSAIQPNRFLDHRFRS